MTATVALTTDLQRVVLGLEDDLRARLATDPALEGRWKQEHHEAVQKERTAAAWTSWRDDRVTQAAVAWVLTTVFIRFCEDNALLRPVWITSPGSRRQEALDAQLAFFRQHPEDTDREWLLDAIGYLSRLPATRGLVESHSALHLISPSGHAAGRLLEFWRRRGEDGGLVHDLADLSLSTRFLGDLYQDLSQHAKDTYALLQTPVFVEEFILDRTMEPALAERPLEGFRLIDPTCGSGHFLLGAFDRLLDRWHRHAPDLEAQARVQAALDAIHGVDLNPFAVAIARFRLTLAALQACGLRSLEQAPAFTFHLAVGDSLIHGPDTGVLPGMSDRSAFMSFTYETEDSALLLTLLEEGRYDVVVGNPPYITVKDKALNQIYRSKYADVCKGKYALTVPFMKLFFTLAKAGEWAGWVGQITSNSFMKREFGAPLIERFLPTRDLQIVADTSGAVIPGHSTGTVVLVGRNRPPQNSTVRAVLRIRGEVPTSEDPAQGKYWSTLVEHVESPGWSDEWITVTDVERESLASHPWSLAGGGAAELRQNIEHVGYRKLRDVAAEIGIVAVLGEEDAFELPPKTSNPQIGLVIGEKVRDFMFTTTPRFWPYNSEFRVTQEALESQWMWPSRRLVAGYLMFGKTRAERGLPWIAYGMLATAKLLTRSSIAYAEIATHNHFVLDREGRIFSQTAPVIKLPMGASDEDYVALWAVLNSSTICFWLKQVCFSKGNATVSSGIPDQPWSWNSAFNATNVAKCPLPRSFPAWRGKVLDELSAELASMSPSAICALKTPTRDGLEIARVNEGTVRARMIAFQEELDWECYRLYGLVEDDFTYNGDDLPELALGERAFEIALACAVENGEDETAWFTRHGSTPITEIPGHWPAGYRELMQRRLDLIASDAFIRLLEKPEYKRRWAQDPWEKRQERALRDWLLDQLEDRRFWFDPQGRPRPRSIAQLADEVGRDPDLVSVLALWEGRLDIPVTRSITRLLADEAVPFLAAYRYKETGLRKREAWEETWALQRREDAGENVGTIQVPPKYTAADFRKSSYWQARGKLDIPKERFILYPDAGRETDPTALLGWAGWDHAQQSLALSVIITDREKDGWPDDRLIPLVAGLAEIQPWVDQWHADIAPDYNLSLAAFCREQLIARAAQVARTIPELAAWRPDAPTRGRRPKRDETKMDSS